MLRAGSGGGAPLTSVILFTERDGLCDGSFWGGGGGLPIFEADSDGVTECARDGRRPKVR